MTPERMKELDAADAKLTLDERKAGWHFCPEWDYMVTNYNDSEGECCSCKPWTKKELKND